MANTLTNLIPKILARSLMNLRELCTMPRIVNSDFGAQASLKGSVIDVPVPVAVGTIPVTPSSTPVAPTNLTPGNVQITLNQWRQTNGIALNDQEMNQIDAKADFLPMQLMEGVRALANEANEYIFSRYATANRGIYGCADDDSVTPFDATNQGMGGATKARRVLNSQACPKHDRRGVLDFDAEENFLSLSSFADAEKTMSALVKIEGDMGRKLGIDWFADDNVPTHTAGTCKTLVGTLTAADTAIGETVITTITSNSASDDGKTVVVGDIVTFSGDSQTYCVTVANTLTGSSGSQTMSNLTIYPALKVATSSSTMTVRASHVLHQCFNKFAYGFAMRPLLDPAAAELGNKILTMTDPVTGISLRMEVSRQHKQNLYELDVLYGAELVRPELACRIFGNSG